jgi:uncharacterized membrane protein YvlD (DUF360 family)
MRGFLIRWAACAFALWLFAHAVDDFEVKGFGAAFLAVAVIAVGNLLLKPMVKAITTAGCLLNLLTLGAFEWAVGLIFYGLAFYLVGAVEFGGRPLVQGFHVGSLGDAFLGAFMMALVNLLTSPLVNRDDKDKDRRNRE